MPRINTSLAFAYDVDVAPVLEKSAASGDALWAEWQERLARLDADGLVDCKLKISPSLDSTSGSLVAVLNNVLRLREEGRFSPLHF